MANSNALDVIIIGGGQSGLACGYFLRRTGLKYIILDEQEHPGGAWNHTWDSLKLFSPAEHSSLPGWLMPKAGDTYPGKEHVKQYLQQYEVKYNLNIERPVSVISVLKESGRFTVNTSKGIYTSTAVISATGTWKKPYIPEYPYQELFRGHQLHSAAYKNADQIAGSKLLIIGGGNSGAQILADLYEHYDTTWVTLKEPKFLPDDVDGRYLFEFATKQYKAKLAGKKIEPVGNLGDVVMVDSVKHAREKGALNAQRPFKAFYEEGVIWSNGAKEKFDTIIWCTGFKSALDHLEAFKNDKGQIPTKLTKSTEIEGLWLVGYGSWTGYASATLIGVGRTARQTVREVENFIN